MHSKRRMVEFSTLRPFDYVKVENDQVRNRQIESKEFQLMKCSKRNKILLSIMHEITFNINLGPNKVGISELTIGIEKNWNKINLLIYIHYFCYKYIRIKKTECHLILDYCYFCHSILS